MSEHTDLKVGTVALVAPWINPDDNSDSDTADFFHFEIDPDFPARTDGVMVFVSSDDDPSVVRTVDTLRSKVQELDIREHADKGHFCLKDLGTAEFPELLNSVLPTEGV